MDELQAGTSPLDELQAGTCPLDELQARTCPLDELRALVLPLVASSNYQSALQRARGAFVTGLASCDYRRDHNKG